MHLRARSLLIGSGINSDAIIAKNVSAVTTCHNSSIAKDESVAKAATSPLLYCIAPCDPRNRMHRSNRGPIGSSRTPYPSASMKLTKEQDAERHTECHAIASSHGNGINDLARVTMHSIVQCFDRVHEGIDQRAKRSRVGRYGPTHQLPATALNNADCFELLARQRATHDIVILQVRRIRTKE